MKDEERPPFDIIVIGAGPGGISVGLAAQRHGLDCLILDKGSICHTIFDFPERMTFFSTSDLVEVPGIPLVSEGDKPTRHEVLSYYTKLALANRLNIATYELVESVTRLSGGFAVKTAKRELRAQAVVAALGTYDQPNLLNVPGEELLKVSHYYHSPHPYVGKRVLVIGGKNSAVETALDLFRHGAEVTMIHRHAMLRELSIKYWLLPDIQNRIKEGSVQAIWNSTVLAIEAERVLIRSAEGERWLDNDAVLAMTGYHPDYAFLESLGLEFKGPCRAPIHNAETLETTVPGIYVAGVITAGADPSRVFIENSRHHGELIIRHFIQTHSRVTV